MYFFVNDSTDKSKFQLIYDNGITSLTKFNAELAYNQNEKLRIGIKSEFNHYQTTNIQKAWQKPTMINNIFATYNLRNKILFYFDIYNMSGLVAKNSETNNETNLNAIFDANLKIDYRYSQKFSTFLELNNILGQKYQRYLNYQNKGFNILAGITYRF